MLASLRPRAATLICTAAFRRTAATMSVAKLSYPKPLVFKSAAEHKSTLIMLHGLGEHRCCCVESRIWVAPVLAMLAAHPGRRTCLGNSCRYDACACHCSPASLRRLVVGTRAPCRTLLHLHGPLLLWRCCMPAPAPDRPLARAPGRRRQWNGLGGHRADAVARPAQHAVHFPHRSHGACAGSGRLLLLELW